MFQKEKKEFLSKKDKSKKGSIDSKIKKLVHKINSNDSYYTTSSCAGRIVLYSSDKSGKKNKFKWHLVSHSEITTKKVQSELKKIKNKDVWLAVEPVIIHVAADSIETAKALLHVARDTGFRRSGIITIRKHSVIMELISTESLQTIVRKNNYEIDQEYLEILIAETNSKLKQTWLKINKLEKSKNN